MKLLVTASSPGRYIADHYTSFMIPFFLRVLLIYAVKYNATALHNSIHAIFSPMPIFSRYANSV